MCCFQMKTIHFCSFSHGHNRLLIKLFRLKIVKRYSHHNIPCRDNILEIRSKKNTTGREMTSND